MSDDLPQDTEISKDQHETSISEGKIGVEGGKPEAFVGNAVASRLRQAVQSAGGNRAVSVKSGVPIGTLGSALSAGSMRLQTAQQLAAATNVSLEWLATGRGPMRPGDTPPPPEPPSSLPAKPAPLFSSVNMDRLAASYLAARTALAGGEPRPIDLVRIMALIYDQLTETDAAPRNKEP